MAVLEIDAKDDPAFASFAPLIRDRMGLFTAEDIQTLAETLPPETSALALLFEHHWAVEIKEAIQEKGGFLVAVPTIPPEVLEEASAKSSRRPKPPSHWRDPDHSREGEHTMMRRRGRPLMRAAATTAVVAGTAGAVRHHQEQKYANQAAEQQGADQSAYEQGVALPGRQRPLPRRHRAAADRHGAVEAARRAPRFRRAQRRGVRGRQGEGARRRLTGHRRARKTRARPEVAGGIR